MKYEVTIRTQESRVRKNGLTPTEIRSKAASFNNILRQVLFLCLFIETPPGFFSRVEFAFLGP